jgi:hypothetical protein
MKNEWVINTSSGAILVNIDFFEKIQVKKVRKISDLLFIQLEDFQTFSISEKDWIEIQQEIRENKINSLIKKIKLK